MDDNSKVLNLAKNISNVTRKLLRKYDKHYDRQSNKKHVKTIKDVMKKNKT